MAEHEQDLLAHLVGTAKDPAPADPTPPSPPPPPVVTTAATDTTPARPDVVVGTDEHLTNADAAAALAAHPNFYQRGDALVRVLVTESDPRPTDAVRRPVGTPTIRTVDKHTLRDGMSSVTRFVRQVTTATGTGFAPAHPPGWCVDAVLHRGDWPGVRPLDAVVPHPIILPDGSIAAESGYHPAAAALVHLPPGVRVDVPDEPTQADAEAAAGVLADVYADFPFQTQAHRSALIAAVLTPLALALYDGPSPLFLIDSNVRGSGKGLAANTHGEIVIGQPLAVMNYTDDLTELSKCVTSIAISGDRVVLLDNLNGSVGNSVLDAMLTTTRWRGRILGESREYNGPLRTIWLATGNNTVLRADTARRTLHIRLQSPEERPETRRGFRHPDLLGHIRTHRGRLLSAALTILRAWVQAGRPTSNLTPWGSYEQWSGVVREAVVFAGLPDPGGTRDAMTAESDESATLMKAVIAGMVQMDPDRKGVTTSEIVERLGEKHPAEWLAGMKEAVAMLCGRVDARSLGYKLRHYKQRNFGGRMIVQTDAAHGNVKRWAVRTVGEAITISTEPAKVCGGDTPTLFSDPVPSNFAQPVWKDPHAFARLMQAARIDWPALSDWLNREHSADLPDDAGFEDVLTYLRQLAAAHLERLAQAA